MAERRLNVLISLADRVRADEIATHLAETEEMAVALAEDADVSARQFDALVADRASAPQQWPTVMLGGDARPEAVRAVLRASASEAEIAAALRLVCAGYAIEPAHEPVPAKSNGVWPHRTIASLTAREQQVVGLLAEGASNKVIARRLDISVHTAKFHVAAILEKLGAVNRTDAIAIAMRDGLVLV